MAVTEIQEAHSDEEPEVQDFESILGTGFMFMNPEVPGLLNPKVLTNERPNMGPLSYANGDVSHVQYSDKLAPPVMIPTLHWTSYSEVRYPERITGVAILKNGKMKVTDQEAIESQKGILGEVIKRMFKAIFSGQGMVRMSLPVKIFEPTSTLQRIGYTFSGYPEYLRKADRTTDMVERVKFVICGVISGLTLNTSQRKPFNPYLGETLTSEFEDGTKLYMEHTIHDPPVSNWLMYIAQTGCKMYGRYEHSADVGANSLEIEYRGPNTIKFSDGTEITVYCPSA